MQGPVGERLGDQLDGAGGALGDAAARLGHALGQEQVAEGGVAGRSRAGQDGQGRVRFLDLAGEKIVAAQHRRAEGRARRHGAAVAGVDGQGAGGLVRIAGGQHRLRRLAHQEASVAGGADQHLHVTRAQSQYRPARLAAARLGEGHVERGRRAPGRQSHDGAGGLGPGGVVGQHPSAAPHQRRRFGHGVQQVHRRVARRAAPLVRVRAPERQHPDQGHRRQGHDQDQARRAPRIVAERRIGRRGHGDDETDRRRHQPGVDAHGGGDVPVQGVHVRVSRRFAGRQHTLFVPKGRQCLLSHERSEWGRSRRIISSSAHSARSRSPWQPPRNVRAE